MQSNEPGALDAREQLTGRVIECIRQLLPRARRTRAIDLSDRMGDLGLDSMRLLELVFLLQDALKLDVDDQEFGRMRVETVGDVVESVGRLMRANR
jgi:acyl carrier protein